MVFDDGKFEEFDFFQKVVGVISDFMATIFGVMEIAFFDDEKIQKNRVFKILFRPFQGTKSLYIRSGNWSKPRLDDF